MIESNTGVRYGTLAEKFLDISCIYSFRRLLGSILGEILGIVAPEGPLRNIFLKAFKIGIDPAFTLEYKDYYLYNRFYILN